MSSLVRTFYSSQQYKSPFFPLILLLYENMVPSCHGGSSCARGYDVFVGLLSPSMNGLERSSGHRNGFLLDQVIGMEPSRTGVDTLGCDNLTPA